MFKMNGIAFQNRQIHYSEIPDRSQLVPGQNLIDYSAWTEGETRLALLAEQLNIIASFYPEDREVQKARGVLIDTLHKGLHRASLPTGILSGKVGQVAREIKKARRMVNPANGERLYGRKNGIGAGIGDPLIPMEDCELIMQEYYQTNNMATLEAYKTCRKENEMKGLLNNHLEKSSHHLLYEFLTPKERSISPNVVAVKSLNHRIGTDLLSQSSQLSRENIRLWMRNGVMRHNALNGLEPLPPEYSIDLLRSNPKNAQGAAVNGVGIGVEPVSTTIALIVAIAKLVGAIAAALSAAAGLIYLLKSKDPSGAAAFVQQTQGIGTETWGPQENDWFGGGAPPPSTTPPDSSSQDQDKALPFIIAGGVLGAYLLLD